MLYLIVLLAAGAAVLGVLHLGQGLAAPGGGAPAAMAEAAAVERPEAGAGPLAAMLAGLQENFHHPLSRLFLQLVVIITASRLMGKAFTALGQPAVVGEMAAGILLGPSLFGSLTPELFRMVFPLSSLDTLKLLSQIGVCIFMFAVGMDLNVKHVKEKAHTAVVVSHAGIVFPYVLGVGLAWFLYTDLAAAGASFTAFALFMGISMSITAFPVLARILQDRGMEKTFLGSTAVTCAAVDDVTAWSILAFVVAIARAGSMAGSALNLVLVALFVLVMLRVVRPLLPRCLGVENLAREHPTKGTLAAIMCVVVTAGMITEVIGIHALFGSFLAGAIMPQTSGFREKLAIRVENFSSVLLLPLFFAYTGLRTQFGLLSGAADWGICLLIILVATAGKLGGTSVTARFTGMSWRDSLQLGALMNTRGLMELIALNIGYDLGILSPRIFTMLVIMALTTTMLTGPLLTLFKAKAAEPVIPPAPASA